jgi:hypothetical protein
VQRKGVSGNPQRRAEGTANRAVARSQGADDLSMPRKADSPEAVLRMLLAQAGDSMTGRLRQELDRQTFVGGRRVDKQQLPALPKDAAISVHVVKVNLYGAKPPVWRRLEIPSAMTLDLVHEVLQVAFGWEDFHLHGFETVCGEFGEPSHDDGWSRRGDESTVALAQVAAEEKAKVVYTYDFGDDWRHDLVVEKIVPASPGVAYPRCIAGRGEAPLEDSGGIWAFHEQRAGGDGPDDPFDPADASAALASMAVVVTPG